MLKWQIGIESRKTIKILENGIRFGLNINEILIDKNLLSNEQLIESFLFDCQCAIFIIDISSEGSFTSVKELLNIIISKYNYPYMNKLLIINKIDLQENKISTSKIDDFIAENMIEFERFEISVKKKQNLEKLHEKVYTCVNQNSHNLAVNLLKEKMEDLQEKNNKYLNIAEGTINIILIGDSGVGKSNLFSRYFQNNFEENFVSTLGVDNSTKLIKYKNHLYNIKICDTAGQERFRSIPIRYYQNADGALLLFDVSNKESFNNVNRWMEDIKKNANNRKQIIYLIGNKIDILKREVSQEEVKKVANSLGLQYFEMSCKININIYEIVGRLIVDCIKNYIKEEKGFELKNKNKDKNNCC